MPGAAPDTRRCAANFIRATDFTGCRPNSLVPKERISLRVFRVFRLCSGNVPGEKTLFYYIKYTYL